MGHLPMKTKFKLEYWLCHISKVITSLVGNYMKKNRSHVCSSFDHPYLQSLDDYKLFFFCFVTII